MIRAGILAVMLAAPAAAMTPADCDRLRDQVVAAVPSAGDIRISPSLTPDGWCRVLEAPFGEGLEFRVAGVGAEFVAEFRQQDVELDALGPFSISGRVQMAETGGLHVGPIIALTRLNEVISFEATTAPLSGSVSEGKDVALGKAELRIAGSRGLVGDVLAWAFRLDARRARSNLTEARDQRAEMLEWLEEVPAGAAEAPSQTAFREIVAAYPNARGAVVLQGSDAALGPLLGAVLFGAPFSREDGAKFLRSAGLGLSWTPE